jgi:hypothetical protein
VAKTEGGRERGRGGGMGQITTIHWIKEGENIKTNLGKKSKNYDHPPRKGGAKGKSGMDKFAFSSELLCPL